MLLLIDVGNTNIVFGLDGAAGLIHQFRIQTKAGRTSDELGALVLDLFRHRGLDVDVDGAIISCVVPDQLPALVATCEEYFGTTPLIVGPGIRSGMPILADNPREVGADRIVNAVAAYKRVGGPCVVVDFGTATTFDCVSARGEYLGGVICPGIHISMEALFDRASKLHRVEIARPKSVIGRTTTGALQSGLLYGYAGLVDSMIVRIRKELGANSKVVATGGLARRIATESEQIEQVAPFLTLEGLRILFEKNRPERL